MKRLLTILAITISISSYAQDEHNCPPGYKWFATFTWDYCTWVGDKCLPDSIYDSWWLDIRKRICSGSGIATFGGVHPYYFYSSGGEWVNDSVGCVGKEEYSKVYRGKRIQLTKCRYYWETGNAGCGTYENDKLKNVPCCGHWHKTAPK